MPKTPGKTRKLSPFFLIPFTFFLTLLLSLPWVNAKEAPKPKPQPWQINGIVAALDDSQDKVKGYAFNQLAEYEPSTDSTKSPPTREPKLSTLSSAISGAISS